MMCGVHGYRTGARRRRGHWPRRRLAAYALSAPAVYRCSTEAASLQADLLRLGRCLGRSGHGDLKDAVFVGSLDLLGPGRKVQGQAPVEAAVTALHAVVVLLLDLMFRLALAADDQIAILQRDIDVLLFHPRQL